MVRWRKWISWHMRHIKFKLFVNFARFKNMCCPCKEIDENSKSKHCKQFKDTSESLQPKTEEISCCSVARWIAIRSLLHYSGYSTVRCCHFKTTWMKKKVTSEDLSYWNWFIRWIQLRVWISNSLAHIYSIHNFCVWDTKVWLNYHLLVRNLS